MLECRVRGKLARTVWSGGKFGDNFKELPITIHHPVRPCHVRQRSKDAPGRFAEPQRADVPCDHAGDEPRRDAAEAGKQHLPGGGRGAEIQLRAAPSGLPAGAGLNVLPPAGP